MAAAARERAAFIEAILAAPADDTPRLVYADWLEENGEPLRAEFIRVQCEVAGPGGVCACRPGTDGGALAACPCRRCRLRRRGRELNDVARHPWVTATWYQPLLVLSLDRYGPGLSRPGWHGNPAGTVLYGFIAGCPGDWAWTMCRGFVDAVDCSCCDWLARGPAVVAAQPVTRVTLDDKEPYRGGPGEAVTWALRVPWAVSPPGWPGDRQDLPAELFEALAGGRQGHYASGRQGHYASGQPRVVYESWAEARDALSAACLAWARGRKL
jgi:uncharacterized protein (TIGR02996 family)